MVYKTDKVLKMRRKTKIMLMLIRGSLDVRMKLRRMMMMLTESPWVLTAVTMMFMRRMMKRMMVSTDLIIVSFW